MKIFGKHHLIISLITFIILFLMNYVGNNEPDKIQTATMIAGAGVIGLTLGLFVLNKNKDDKNPPPDFD